MREVNKSLFLFFKDRILLFSSGNTLNGSASFCLACKKFSEQYLNKDLNLSKNLTKIALTNGPGSYTSLRVGSAFVSGLKISQDLLIYTISAHDIIKFKSEINKTNEMGIFIYSANNQKFLCTVNSHKEAQYQKLYDDNIVLPKNIREGLVEN